MSKKSEIIKHNKEAFQMLISGIVLMLGSILLFILSITIALDLKLKILGVFLFILGIVLFTGYFLNKNKKPKKLNKKQKENVKKLNKFFEDNYPYRL